jgi:hypothetical protein
MDIEKVEQLLNIASLAKHWPALQSVHDVAMKALVDIHAVDAQKELDEAKAKDEKKDQAVVADTSKDDRKRFEQEAADRAKAEAEQDKINKAKQAQIDAAKDPKNKARAIPATTFERGPVVPNKDNEPFRKVEAEE